MRHIYIVREYRQGVIKSVGFDALSVGFANNYHKHGLCCMVEFEEIDSDELFHCL